jgi:hypothetical protein
MSLFLALDLSLGRLCDTFRTLNWDRVSESMDICSVFCYDSANEKDR